MLRTSARSHLQPFLEIVDDRPQPHASRGHRIEPGARKLPLEVVAIGALNMWRAATGMKMSFHGDSLRCGCRAASQPNLMLTWQSREIRVARHDAMHFERLHALFAHIS
jgi:hypothetical protein